MVLGILICSLIVVAVIIIWVIEDNSWEVPEIVLWGVTLLGLVAVVCLLVFVPLSLMTRSRVDYINKNYDLNMGFYDYLYNEVEIEAALSRLRPLNLKALDGVEK